jgi:hypothetical protein
VCDGARRAPDERRVERGRLADHLRDVLLGEQQHGGVGECARGGAVHPVVEEQSFADGLARAQRGDADRSAMERFLDRDRSTHDDRHDLSLVAP